MTEGFRSSDTVGLEAHDEVKKAGKATAAGTAKSAAPVAAQSEPGPECEVHYLGRGRRHLIPEVLDAPAYPARIGEEEFTHYLRLCDDGSLERYAWPVRTALGEDAPAAPEEIAQHAQDWLQLPKPTAGRAPDLRFEDGRPYTVVGAHTWYWTDPAVFTTRKKRVDAGDTWVEVTATPVALEFTPGDGSRPVSCADPGVAFRPGHHNWSEPNPESPSGCHYTYQQPSVHLPDGMLTATQGIRWRITWRGGEGSRRLRGSVPDIVTTASSRFAVAEIQVLNTVTR